MKLLTLFIAVCAVLIGWLGWQLVSVWHTRSLPVAARIARPAPAHRAAAPLPAQHAATGAGPVASAPADEPADDELVTSPTSTAVRGQDARATRWATEPEETAAWNRLERAADTLRTDPYHPAALRDQAAALAALKHWSEAADTLARLRLTEKEDAALAFEHATLLMRARRWVDAREVLTALVAQVPEHARGWFNLAITYQAVGHLAQARSAWDQAITLSRSAEALARRGEVLLDLHEWAAAAADFEAALAYEPDVADTTLNLSLALCKLGRDGEARARLMALLAAHPRHVPTLNRLAEMAWAAHEAAPDEQERRDEALGWWRQSLECDPQQTDVRERLTRE